MPDQAEVIESTKFQIYVDGLVAGLYDNKTKQDIADGLGVDRKTLWNWIKKVDWKRVVKERRELYAHDILEIDQALFKAAKNGDVQAIELAYKRFDGWVPESALKINHLTDADLIEEAARIKVEMESKVTEVKSVASAPGPDIPGAGSPAAA